MAESVFFRLIQLERYLRSFQAIFTNSDLVLQHGANVHRPTLYPEDMPTEGGYFYFEQEDLQIEIPLYQTDLANKIHRLNELTNFYQIQLETMKRILGIRHFEQDRTDAIEKIMTPGNHIQIAHILEQIVSQLHQYR